MNQKKCPKCGELNPPEAVMCWACYTPLSGDSGGASSAPRPSVANEEREKPGFATWQIGLVVVVLLGAIGFGAKTFLGSGSESEDVPTVSVSPGGRLRPSTGNNPGGNITNNNPLAIPAPSPNQAPIQPQPAQTGTYSVVSSPNPKYTFGVIGIVPSDPNTTSDQAAQMAAGVRQKMMGSKKWAILHIYVFKDRQTGLAFRKYQNERRGRPLDPGDYQSLSSNVWPNTLVRYEYNRGVEGVQIPMRNPTSWWDDKTSFAKVVKTT